MSHARRLAAALGLAAALCTAVLWTLLSSASAAPSSVTTPFTYTGQQQTFKVPDGVTELQITAIGGHGGHAKGETASGGGAGGSGALASANLPVSPGQVLFVEVGGNAADSTGSIAGDPGANGGGSGGPGDGDRPYAGGSGGGASDVRTVTAQNPVTYASRLIVAGGGGGGGAYFVASTGGNAGLDALAGNGANGGGTCGGGGGSNNNGGGAAGGPGSIGGFLGGGGIGASGQTGNDVNFGGGGGGSGLFGGGGGCRGGFFAPGNGGGGGGGSSGFAVTATDRKIGPAPGDPLIRISYVTGGGTGSKSGLKYGKVKLNKAKGTATLPVTVPGTGDLSVGGKGVVKKRPGLSGTPRLTKAITKAGTYKLKIKAKGKKKGQLFATGKVKVKAVVTFKPTSGDAVHDTRKIKLKKS